MWSTVLRPSISKSWNFTPWLSRAEISPGRSETSKLNAVFSLWLPAGIGRRPIAPAPAAKYSVPSSPFPVCCRPRESA